MNDEVKTIHDIIRVIKDCRKEYNVSEKDNKGLKELASLVSTNDAFLLYAQQVSGSGCVMCPNCYSIKPVKDLANFDFDYGENGENNINFSIPEVTLNHFICEKCKSDMILEDKHYPIIIVDEMIADLVSDLNKNGLYVDKCCSGHIGSELSRSYIMFNTKLMKKENELFIVNFFKGCNKYLVDEYLKHEGLLYVCYKPRKRNKFTVDDILDNVKTMRKMLEKFNKVNKMV